MATPIADAFVRLRPDVSGFRAEVAATVGQTLSRIGTGGGATVGLGKHAVALEGVAQAGLTAAGAERAYAAAVGQGGVVLGAATQANNALAASQTRVAKSAGAAGFVSQFTGLRQLADESNFLRGILIGLSRITPVAVFGLGIVGTAAIAAGLAMRAAVRDAAEFEQSLNVLQAVTRATGQEMRAVQDEAEALGRDVSLPGVSANDAAVAMLELSKAGLSVEQSMEGARGVLELATAAEISAGEAAKITASALNAFALSGEEASRVADLLAASSIAAQGEITDMAAALQQASAVAANANISVEDTVAAITLLAQSGLLGSDAGTSLRTTILRLVPTTKEAAQFQRALGVETTTTAGEIKDLADVSEEYRLALQDLSEVQQQQALQQIFGQDAIRAATIFAREGAAGFNEAREQVEREGAAAEIAAAKSKGLSGAVEGLKSNAQTLATTLGLLVVPALTDVVQIISGGIGVVNEFVDLLNELGDVEVPEIDIQFNVRGLPGLDLPNIPGFEPLDVASDVGEFLVKRTGPVGIITNTATAIEKAGDAVGFFGDKLGLTADEADRAAVALTEAQRRAVGFGGTLQEGIPIGLPESFLPELPDTAPTQREIEQAAKGLETTIRGQLRLLSNLGAAAFESEGEAAREELERQIDGLIRMGFIAGKQLANISRQAVPFLGESLRRQIQSEVVPNLFVEPLISEALREDITRLSQLPGGTAELQATGNAIVEAIAEGVDQSNAVVEAAERALDDAIEHMNEAIADAVQQAGDNLDSLGQELASKVGEVIDQMDFGVPRLQRQTIRIELETNVREATRALAAARAQGLSGAELDPFIANVTDATDTLDKFATSGKASIETLQDALDGLERRFQRRALRFDLRQAQRDLRDAQAEIANLTEIGAPTPGQQQAINEALDPFFENVAQRQGEIQKFDLSTQIDTLTDITDAFKKASEEGIARLINDFKTGRITAEQFSNALNTKLKPILDTVKTDFGKNLGFSFTQDFLDTFDALVLQARLLTGFLTILGAQPGKDVVDIGKVQKEQRQQVAQARRNLENSLKNQETTARNSVAQVKLLGLILAAISDPTPDTPITKKDLDITTRRAEVLTGLDIPNT